MKTTKSLLFTFLCLFFAAPSFGTQVEIDCPCTVNSIGLTGISITAGVTNEDTSASGALRFRVISYGGIDGLVGFRSDSFQVSTVYKLSSGLSAGSSISSTTFKSGFTLPSTGEKILALILEEQVGSSWTRRYFVRLTPNFSPTDGGEIRSSLDGALYFDGDPVLTVNGGQASISFPPLVNTSSSFNPGALTFEVIETNSSSGFNFSNALFSVNPVGFVSSLPPKTQTNSTSVDVAFSDNGSNFHHLLIRDSSNTPLLYQTIRTSSGALPTRNLNVTGIDVITDSDGDGVTDYGESLKGTDSQNASSKPAESQIDVLVLYSQSVPGLYNGDPSARIDQIFQVGNRVLQNSGLSMSVRSVNSQQISVTENLTLESHLNSMDDHSGAFSNLNSLKEAASADLVILLLPFPGGDLCGLANLGGFASNGDFLTENNRNNANGAVYINCDDTTLIHEIGHILGLGHSRAQDGNEGGTFPWAVGYGINNSFTTVMAYGSAFNTNNEVLTFSSPNLTCEGVPCGISSSDSQNGADASLGLRVSQYQVESYYASAADTDGDGTPDVSDSDDDNDGVPDVSDAFPIDSSEFVDTDGDGTGNNADTDDDGDGIADSEDRYPLDATNTPQSRLANLATRGFVGSGDQVLIGGLVISGTSPKNVVITAKGPSLADAGVSGVLPDSFIQLFSGADQIDTNNNWRDHENVGSLPEGLRPSNDLDAAMYKTLNPGAYTAIVSGVGGTTGVGIVEVYEVEDSGALRLINIATRGFIGTGDSVLIGGLVVTGSENKRVVITAKGPSLAASGVSGVISNPQIQLFRGSEQVDFNDNWQDHADAGSIPENLRPFDSFEGAMYKELAPGAYTAIVSGVGGATGVGIVEVYEIE